VRLALARLAASCAAQAGPGSMGAGRIYNEGWRS